jgi:hypothetical protein
LCIAWGAGARAAEPAGPVELTGEVPLERRAPTDGVFLDVGVVTFDPGIPADAATHGALGIFPEIRRAEARYLPVLLRQALVDSGAWGAVRVMPEASLLPELRVTGAIEQSDGRTLQLAVRAVDAADRVWLDTVYRDEAVASDYPVAPGADPFGDLYRAVANDLLARRDALGEAGARAVRRVAFLRYASSLSPEAFDGFLAGGGGQPYSVSRLPAEGDPMIGRVERIRNYETVFIDTVDEQYLALQEEMAETYDLWRQYDRERAIYLAGYEQRAKERDSAGSRGSFAAMQQSYSAYRTIKLQQQDLQELALGFNNEVAPTLVEASGRVFRLTGNLDDRYSDWRRILEEIFALESGGVVSE